MPARRLKVVPLLALVLAAASLLAPPVLPAAVGSWVENPECRVRLVSPYRAAPAQGELRLGLQIELASGWHSYWKNSGDAGYPPELDFSATPEIAGARLLWPAPERYEMPGALVAFGYEGEVIYPVRAQIAAAGREKVEITAEVDYVVCEVECVPYHHSLTLEQPLAAGAPLADPELEAALAAWEARVPRSPEELGVETTARLEPPGAGGPVLEVRVAGGGVSPAGAHLFLESHELFDAGTPEAETVPGGVRFTVPLERRNLSAPWPREVEIAWTVTDLELAGEAVSLEARRRVGPEPAAAAGPGPAGRPAAWWRVLLQALAGGFLLALTPGALTLWLLVAAELRWRRGSGAGAASTRTGAWAAAGGAFTGGLVLAAAALAGRRGGADAGWGTQFDQPALLTAALLAFLLLALHLWGMAPLSLGRRWSLALAGLAAPLLALPFDPPGLAAAAGAALARGPAAGLAAGAALGMGLALPYLLLQAAPAMPDKLPALPPDGPGRPALGFLPAAGLVWGLYLLAGRLPAAELAFVELALLTLALFAWLRRRARRGMMRAVFAAGIVLAGLLAILLAAG